MDLSVVIPAYNEEACIKQTLQTVLAYLNGKSWTHEVIVVDDGSTDRTCELVQEFPVTLLKNGKNKGKGATVRKGMLAAQGNRILFSDADLSTPIRELQTFMESDADVVIGSRAIKGAHLVERQPAHRELLGRAFNILVQSLSVKGIKDTQCGFKLFTQACAHDVFKKQQLEGFCFDVEVLFIAQKGGYSIKELPVVWKNSSQSKVRPVVDAVKMFCDLLKIRTNSVRGTYGSKR